MSTAAARRTARWVRRASHRAFWLCVWALILGDVILSVTSTRPGNDPRVLGYVAVLASVAVLCLVAYFIALPLSRDIVGNEFSVSLAEENHRPLVVFLRSFDVARSGLGQRVLELTKLIWELDPRSSKHPSRFDIEEEIDDAIFRHASFVAIGNKRTSYGATKIVVKDEEWKEIFRRLTASASLILMMPGPSLSVHWELSQIVGSTLLKKTVVIMPRRGSIPGLDLRQMVASRHASREAAAWAEVSEAAARDFGIALPRYQEDGGCFRLDATGRPSKTVGLEHFTHALHKYLAHHADAASFDIEEMWKSMLRRN